jgi:hypothetical protein
VLPVDTRMYILQVQKEKYPRLRNFTKAPLFYYFSRTFSEQPFHQEEARVFTILITSNHNKNVKLATKEIEETTYYRRQMKTYHYSGKQSATNF